MKVGANVLSILSEDREESICQTCDEYFRCTKFIPVSDEGSRRLGFVFILYNSGYTCS